MVQPEQPPATVSGRAAVNTLLVIGLVMTLAGVALLVLPGPGLAVLTLGVLVLLVAIILRVAVRS